MPYLRVANLVCCSEPYPHYRGHSRTQDEGRNRHLARYSVERHYGRGWRAGRYALGHDSSPRCVLTALIATTNNGRSNACEQGGVARSSSSVAYPRSANSAQGFQTRTSRSTAVSVPKRSSSAQMQVSRRFRDSPSHSHYPALSALASAVHRHSTIFSPAFLPAPDPALSPACSPAARQGATSLLPALPSSERTTRTALSVRSRRL